MRITVEKPVFPSYAEEALHNTSPQTQQLKTHFYDLTLSTGQERRHNVAGPLLDLTRLQAKHKLRARSGGTHLQSQHSGG